MTKRTENAVIASAQANLAGFKSDMIELQKINFEAGRLAASSACMGIHGQAQTLHANATEKLYEHYPEIAGGVVQKGGGGR